MYGLCQLRIIELHTINIAHVKLVFIFAVNEFLLLASYWPICWITLLIGCCSLDPPPPPYVTHPPSCFLQTHRDSDTDSEGSIFFKITYSIESVVNM